MADPARLEAIEIKCAHLEQAVQQMSDELAAQQRLLQRLAAQHRALLERFDQIGTIGESPEQAEPETPPHY